MNSQSNLLKILINTGLIWCVISMVYTAGQYFAHSRSEIVIQASKPGEDVIIKKISKLLNDNNKSLIINELRNRNDQITVLHTSLVTMNSIAKKHVRDEILLWFGVVVIFSILAIRYRAR